MPAFPLNDHWTSSPKDSIVEQTFSVGREGAAALGLASSNFSLLHFPNMMEDRGFPEVIFFSFVFFWFFCVFFREATSWDIISETMGLDFGQHWRGWFSIWIGCNGRMFFVFYSLIFVGMFMGLSGESTPQMDRLILNIIWCQCGRISFYCHMTNSICFAVEFIFF